MKTLVMLLVFISGFLIISGVHEQRIQEANKNRKVVYRYVPRSALDQQFYGTPASAHFQGMFGEGKSPWLEARTPQEEAGRPDYEWATPPPPLVSDPDRDGGHIIDSDSDSESDPGSSGSP